MATDYFMKIDGIPGDSIDAKHPNEIRVTSWSWGETNASTLVPSTSARSDLQDFHFTARTSKASPLLFLACAGGAHSTTAVLTGRKAGATPVDFLTITLTDVLITSYQVAANAADDVPLDQVSMEFARIQISYVPQNSDGSLGTPITRGWDRVLSKGF